MVARGTNLSNGGNISGANTATLSVSNIVQADAADYSLIVSNSYSSVTSSVATLVVNDPAINTQPLSQTLPPGTNATFRVVAGGTAPLAYTWYKDAASSATAAEFPEPIRLRLQ